MTETSVEYFTSNLVTSFYSTISTTSANIVPLHFRQTPYDFSYQTGLFSLNQMDALMIRMNNDWEDYPCLYYDYFRFNATAGHEIRGHFELSEKSVNIHFFILSEYQFRNFQNCGFGNWKWDVHAFASSYDIDWVVPESGIYLFLFLSRGYYGGLIYLTAQDYSTTVQTSIELFPTTATYTFQSNQLMPTTLSSVSPQPSPSSAGYYDAAAVLVVIAALAAILFILRKKLHR